MVCPGLVGGYSYSRGWCCVMQMMLEKSLSVGISMMGFNHLYGGAEATCPSHPQLWAGLTSFTSRYSMATW